MDAYQLLERLGSGSFSVVWKARERASGRLFAVKELLDPRLEWGAVQALPEVTAARLLPLHEGLLRLHAVHRVRGRVFMVMDYCRGSLLDAVAASGGGLPEAQVRHVMRRLLAALAALHASGHMHRDLKPENVLLGSGGGGGGAGASAAGSARPMLGDFGQLRALAGGGGGGGGGGAPLTPYVSTRWYRAPEVLLRSPAYGAPCDVWAMGALMCELLSGRPAFPGTSEADQLFRLCAVLGAPTREAWPEGLALAGALGATLPSLPPRGLASLLPPATSPAAVAAIGALLAWSPARRVSARGALETLEFFTCPGAPEAPLALRAAEARPGEEARARAEAEARQGRLEEELAAERGGGSQEGKAAEGAALPAGAGAAQRGSKEADSDEEGAAAAPAGAAAAAAAGAAAAAAGARRAGAPPLGGAGAGGAAPPSSRGAGASAGGAAAASLPARSASARGAMSLFAGGGKEEEEEEQGAGSSGITYGGGKEASDDDEVDDDEEEEGGGYKPSCEDSD
jgi:protein kinase